MCLVSAADSCASPTCILEFMATPANPGNFCLCRHLLKGSVRLADGRWTDFDAIDPGECVCPTGGG